MNTHHVFKLLYFDIFNGSVLKLKPVSNLRTTVMFSNRQDVKSLTINLIYYIDIYLTIYIYTYLRS